MSRSQPRQTEVWVDIETGEYITYWPNETKPDPNLQPEMEYVDVAPEGDWEAIDKVIAADRVKRGWETQGPSLEGPG